MSFPEEIANHLKNESYDISTVGMTKANVYIFDQYVLKVERVNVESDNEFFIYKYLQGRLKVPTLVEHIQENGYNYLLMSKLDGLMAFDEILLCDPENVIRLLASAIKMLWEVDTTDLVHDYNLEKKLEYVSYRVENNLVDESELDPNITRGLSQKELVDYLVRNKPVEDKVFTHGDYCLPNVLFKDNQLVGFIDLGRACVSDRYQDISLVLRSLKYNLGDRYKDEYFNLFFTELGIDFDEEKYYYYLLLDELF